MYRQALAGRPWSHPSGFGQPQATPVPASAPALVLDGFAFDSSTPTPLHQTLIVTFATNVVSSGLTPTPIISMRIVGHTVVSGPERYNRGLGLRRAQAVAAALTQVLERQRPGLSRQIAVVTDSMGESLPVSRTDPARNRRVEVFVTRRAAPPPPPPTRPTPVPPVPRPQDARCPRGKFLSSGMWTRNTTVSIQGGQGMRFYLKNRNVLGTTIRITAQTGETDARILLPMGSAEMYFSIFGNEPMGWRFEIETESDVFMVEWTLCSTWVPGDPPNP
jgi:hypothetical protein